MKSLTVHCVALLFLLAATLPASPVRLRCEHLTDPLGIDIPKPRLSWQSDNRERNWTQSAYQILIASRLELLSSGKPDVWDSGKQASGESTGIEYAGPPLSSRQRYFWTVRVWDAKGRASTLAQPAWWEMGLTTRSDWSAKWIRWQDPEQAADESGIRWIWLPAQDALHAAPGTVAEFHYDLTLDATPQRALLLLIARGDWKVTVNGQDAGAKKHWNEFDSRDIATLLTPGRNSADIIVTAPPAPRARPNAPPDPTRPAALAALLKITRPDGTIDRIPTDSSWQARSPGAEWQPAAVAGTLSDTAFGSPGLLPEPASQLRHVFRVSKPIQQARAYVTALGAYEMFLNGKRLGTGVLTPGFTDFAQRTQYQTFDITALLTQGDNAAAATLGNGWFGSGLFNAGAHFRLLPPTRFLAQMEIAYVDGTHESVVTDESWKASASPILHSEIYAGETVDARLEQPGWQNTGFNDSTWLPAAVAEPYGGTLSSQVDAPPRVVALLKPEHMAALPNGTYVYDMAQNMVGWVSLKVRGPRGSTVRLRFAERLNPDGSIYRENLRNADATDSYTLRGGGEEAFTPKFTFHGFRYVELTGYPGTPTLDSITGQVVSSIDGEPTATLTTSSELVNHMWGLGIWGQRGNFLSIPTDCPQRDERLGWMADAAVFWRTGSYNFDISAFTNKWLRDVDDAQQPDGAFTNVAPNIGVDNTGAPGWGDAGVIVPFTAWLQYGDRSAIERNWPAMERWMKFIADNNPDFIRKNKIGPNFADWLAPDTTTPTDLTNTAYWTLIAGMMTQMAHVIGNDDAARRYGELQDQIRAAFQRAFVKETGEVGSGSQTSYVLALHMNLLPPELEAGAVNNLVQNIEQHTGHLTTGFLGTPFLLFTLADHGRADVAYRLLLNDTYPSWGYMLSKGATTWWERWNGDTGDPGMNSYNHYAFGSVMAWVYQCVTGIDTSTSGPGFHHIVIHPRMIDSSGVPSITEAHGKYESAYGDITTAWKHAPGGPFTLDVTIPANTTADVMLPAMPGGHVTQNGKAVKAKVAAGVNTLQVGSGTYRFREN